MAHYQYITTAFKEEIRRLKENKYHPYSNPNGIDNLPHAIKLLSLSPRGERYKKAHLLQTEDVQQIIANELNVSLDELHARMDDAGTVDSHIYHLNIPNRTLNALTHRGFHTIKSVLDLQYDRALKIRNISEDYIQDLIQSIKTWAKDAQIDIDQFPLIETMADPNLWTIGPNELKPYLAYPFSDLLNHDEPLSVDTLNVTKNVIKALKKNNIRTLQTLARKPIPQWIAIKGLGRKTVMTLVLQLVEADKRLANAKPYIANVNIQLSLQIDALSKEEVYEKTIDHLYDILNSNELNITINDKP